MSISSWSEHLARDRNAASWPAMLSKLRTPDELAIRRAEFWTPHTRIQSGFIRKRWFEAVYDAIEFMNSGVAT